MSHRHGSDALVAGAGTVDDARRWIDGADAVLIGAGAGLSSAAGYDYGDHERFAELFPALKNAGFDARYELIGYPLPPRHQWGFWAVHVNDIRLGGERSPVYERLRQLVGDREYFVMSSNVDALFTRNGFADDKVYTPQGDYALYQCLTPCTRQVWDARPVLERALGSYDAATGAVAEDAVPSCPNCGGPVYLNVFAGRFYINDHFQAQAAAANAWLRDVQARRLELAVIDVGTGFNTPGVIRWPMEQVVRGIDGSRLIRINRDHPGVPADLRDRAASLSDDASHLIARLTEGGNSSKGTLA